ncbi:MAG: tRNA preQ1(34) S-adenosylmethionine ribosyltransferase-isomerase QueA [Myxococcota bacterium]|nr:tRNA preQ1(34) S-adenosylmethionine ribosyltransferase-isomerase QueA [Myxococcota bacterium]
MPDELAELAAYDFALPPTAIAQSPSPERDAARLLVLDRAAHTGVRAHTRVRALPRFLRAGDLLVVNRTRVLAARLRGRKHSGGRVEALLLGAVDAEAGRHRALLRSSGRPREGLELEFAAATGGQTLAARVCAVASSGEVDLVFEPGSSPYELGEPPLPPYIQREQPRAEDRERYQTVYGDAPGAVAAPTAGLHLTASLLAELEANGIERASVVLHVGLGTFKPLERSQLESGRLHPERFELTEATAAAVAGTRARGGRVVAVGTTTARVLETCATDRGEVLPARGETELFLRPGDRFRAVDGLLTNFHLPRSSLLMLVCAFAGRERVLDAYREALEHDYRFYSYGDAMLVL